MKMYMGPDAIDRPSPPALTDRLLLEQGHVPLPPQLLQRLAVMQRVHLGDYVEVQAHLKNRLALVEGTGRKAGHVKIFGQGSYVFKLVSHDRLTLSNGQEVLDVSAFREEVFQLVDGELAHLTVAVSLDDLHLLGRFQEFDLGGGDVEDEAL